ncbi:hypothetical protein A0H81_02955 [Grifola frondosa]|uniref:Uncharacterized protein n=1 Tax=Grifola frondosa TaxID=5627 RepID=A0A1C7MHG0_GRIFR|nr:hypothetical protein A0H81_02955 [Grifola frondosa]
MMTGIGTIGFDPASNDSSVLDGGIDSGHEAVSALNHCYASAESDYKYLSSTHKPLHNFTLPNTLWSNDSQADGASSPMMPGPDLDGVNPPFAMPAISALEIHSPELIKVGQDVIGPVQGISWTAKPLRIDPQTLLCWLSELQAYADDLASKAETEPAESSTMLHTLTLTISFHTSIPRRTPTTFNHSPP